ncbi:MAG TPA: type II secretion system major pseudopilin GspG [Candidatus Hydrogenedentes bacterium]|nr:type II secretion system major pseudopilin GspG [Candidatus Hydrogenedentota bacterium]HOT50792.1 type II secretion system major pseudopilin GspG [Candidatus Hydrogenedentota bacterium]HOV74466.1 type II secretion system major pseudopilin GspG [Candidatus Hydrogenedentota bacterium]HPC17260.1 type II secretion system major pseudopilin GspG [Candidatus Hydrogenedentota bacterium]HRT21175.1 type II secretion system major pseudopilin GspG [Candidatus Hydrogenedentota bacterium]
MNAESENRRRRNRAGFTLIELMVVISIIAILATIVGYNVIGAMDDASVAQAKSQIRSFKTALLAYRLKFNRFPTTAEGLGALIDNEKGIKFLDAASIPKDPWGNEYQYSSDSAREFRVISYGADGRPGGSGYDADIDSSGEEAK